MTRIDDGGPAYPVPSAQQLDDGRSTAYNTFMEGFAGMSLRDWFAGQALAGDSANTDLNGEYCDYAVRAYGQADAMLAERSKGDIDGS